MNTEPPKPTRPGKNPDARNEADPAQLLREGMAAAKLGDKEAARDRFQQVVTLDPRNEQGWYWLASVAESAAERKTYLEKVIALNPRNQRAQALLDQVLKAAARGLPPPSPTGDAAEAPPTSEEILSALRSPLARADEAALDEESAPGAPHAPGAGHPAAPEKPARRNLLPGLLIAVLVVAIVGALAVIVMSGSATPPPVPTVASLAQSVTETTLQTAQAGGPASGAATGAATQVARAATGAATGPAELATIITQTPAPTFTAQPSPTKAGIQTLTPLAFPPSGLPGRLLAVSGSYIAPTDMNLPLFLIDPADWKLRPIVPGERGEYAILMPDGQRVLYSRLASGTNSQQLRLANLDGSRASDASSLWGKIPPLADQRMVSIARSGIGLVLVGQNLLESDNSPDIYYASANLTASGPAAGAESTTEATAPAVTAGRAATATSSRATAKPRVTPRAPTETPVPLTPTETATPEPFQAHRLTAKDSGYHSWPSLSPDGRTVVFANDANPAGLGGTHLYRLPVEGGEPTELTSSLGTLAETEPEWSPDGKQIAFRVVPKDTPADASLDSVGQIYVMNADGSSPHALVTGPGGNIRPHWSPDGKYIAFSSTRSGKWEIYLVDVASGTIYQVTQTDKLTFCTAWVS